MRKHSNYLCQLLLLNLLYVTLDTNASDNMNLLPNDVIFNKKIIEKVKENYLHIDGNIRSYYFRRNYHHTLPNQSAFSLGGKLNALSNEFFHYRAGATIYTAQPFGLNSPDHIKIDKTLPGSPVTVLGQAFLQYEDNKFLLRAGNQLITSPWINEADSRMIPATYQAIYSQFNVTDAFNFIAFRAFRFKSRISSQFSKTNLYSPQEGGSITYFNSKSFIGALALGGKYQHKLLNIQMWGYQFYDIAKLFYGDIRYTMQLSQLIKPLIGWQFAREKSDTHSAFTQAGLGRINAIVYGVLLGGEIADGSLTLAYNYIDKNKQTFKNGDIASPYTNSYASDPLYTSSMIAGLIEKTAGSAIKLTGQYHFLDNQFSVTVGYSKYLTQPFTKNTNEVDLDLLYALTGSLKDLSIRYRIGILNNDQNIGKFVYNRLMIQYNFS